MHRHILSPIPGSSPGAHIMKTFGIISDHRALLSKSPAMHNRVMGARGFEGIYVPFQVEENHLKTALDGIRALGISGVNITVPYKQTALGFLDEIQDTAMDIGAVNTIVVDGSRLIGHNTDAQGFMEAVKLMGMDPSGISAILFGTGGAARAALYGLMKNSPKDVKVIGRRLSSAEALCSELGGDPLCLDDQEGIDLSADLVVNATSVSSPAESRELAERIACCKVNGRSLVMDLNYGREENFWRELAERCSAQFSDGLRMLACQGALSFRLWTGIDVDYPEFLSGLE
jgi:shikimate dehydrogenase